MEKWKATHLCDLKVESLELAYGLWLPHPISLVLGLVMQNQVSSTTAILVATHHPGIRSHLNLAKKLLDLVKHACCHWLACHTAASVDTAGSCWEDMTCKFSAKAKLHCTHCDCKVGPSVMVYHSHLPKSKFTWKCCGHYKFLKMWWALQFSDSRIFT